MTTFIRRGTLAWTLLCSALVWTSAEPTLATNQLPRPDPERASVSSSGVQAGRPSYDAALSGNGRYVVFTSAAANLVPGDTNGDADVFLRDTFAGTTTRASVSPSGGQLQEGGWLAAISPNARYILFNSSGRQMVNHVYVYDRRRETSTLEFDQFFGAAGAGATGISRDGNLIVNHSEPDFSMDVFVYNRNTGNMRLASRNNQGRSMRDSFGSNISADGRLVPFSPGFGQRGVYLRNLPRHRTFLISKSINGKRDRRGASAEPFVSSNGRYVAFSSTARNLVRRDRNDERDIFVRDRHRHRTVLVSIRSNGRQGNGPSSAPSITANGRFVVFTSSASNLVRRDRNDVPDVFIHDLRTGRTRCISVDAAGQPSRTRSPYGYISVRGREVAFVTRSSLVPDDTNRVPDVYVRR